MAERLTGPRADLDRLHVIRPELGNVIKQLTTREEFLAARWALDYLPALTAPTPHPWQLVSYEELFLHPGETMASVFAKWGIQAPDGMLERASRPSSMTSEGGIAGLQGWKQRLTKSQAYAILDVVSRFGIGFYNDAPEPDYSLLRSVL